MHKDKEENSHHDSHYRARELAALAAYDHHHLDGEMFLQVSTWNAHYVEQPVFTISFGRARILKMHIGARIYRAVARRDTHTCFLLALFRSIVSIRQPWRRNPSSRVYEIYLSQLIGTLEKINRPRDDESREIFNRFAGQYVKSLVTGLRASRVMAVSAAWQYLYILYTYIYT